MRNIERDRDHDLDDLRFAETSEFNRRKIGIAHLAARFGDFLGESNCSIGPCIMGMAPAVRGDFSFVEFRKVQP